jgi:hypothetical protein
MHCFQGSDLFTGLELVGCAAGVAAIALERGEVFRIFAEGGAELRTFGRDAAATVVRALFAVRHKLSMG